MRSVLPSLMPRPCPPRATRSNRLRAVRRLAALAAVALAACISSVVSLPVAAREPAAAELGTRPVPPPLDLAYTFEVDRRLDVPPAEQVFYAQLLDAALRQHEPVDLPTQYVALVDRNAHVQAIFLYRLDASAVPRGFQFIGASPVSTGQPGRYDYFETPTGVFAHTLANHDFRAEGTQNSQGILGYGVQGMRVYDFGWVLAQRGWKSASGKGGTSQMRLQMHATDPYQLEQRLGLRASKGCIRIPASLNDFLDRYGVLDADYEQALAAGARLWVMRADRTPVPDAGRYLVVVDSARSARPDWSPSPLKKRTASPVTRPAEKPVLPPSVTPPAGR